MSTLALRRCKGKDEVTLVGEKTFTREGFLKTRATIARTGIQKYTKLELGIDASDEIVSVYRSPDEVFDPEAMASFEGQTITFFHPDKGVDAKNYREHTRGDMCNIGEQDRKLLQADLTVKDQGAIEGISYGTRELSCGYDFDYDPTPGLSPDGQAFDAQQRNIRGNHLAIVYRGRCGAECRIGDGAKTCAGDCGCQTQKPGERTMPAPRTIIIDGISIELDPVQAGLVEKVIRDATARAQTAQDTATAATTRATTAETARDKAIADLATATTAHTTAITAAETARTKLVADHATVVADLQAKIPTDAQLEARAAERSTVVADSKKLFAEIKDEGKSIAAIRVEALAHVMGTESPLKAIATAALDGVDLSKAEKPEELARVKTAFATIVAAAAATPRVSDADIGAALGGRASGGSSGGDKPVRLSGRLNTSIDDNAAAQ